MTKLGDPEQKLVKNSPFDTQMSGFFPGVHIMLTCSYVYTYM